MARELIFYDENFTFSGNLVVFKSSGPLEKGIIKNKYAIGLTGVSSANKRTKDGMKILSVDNLSPTYENISSGKYPLIRPLYLTIPKKNPKPEALKFIKFAQSPKGKAIIKSQGTVFFSDGLKAWSAYKRLMRKAKQKASLYKK